MQTEIATQSVLGRTKYSPSIIIPSIQFHPFLFLHYYSHLYRQYQNAIIIYVKIKVTFSRSISLAENTRVVLFENSEKKNEWNGVDNALKKIINWLIRKWSTITNAGKVNILKWNILATTNPSPIGEKIIWIPLIISFFEFHSTDLNGWSKWYSQHVRSSCQCNSFRSITGDWSWCSVRTKDSIISWRI